MDSAPSPFAWLLKPTEIIIEQTHIYLKVLHPDTYAPMAYLQQSSAKWRNLMQFQNPNVKQKTISPKIDSDQAEDKKKTLCL